MMAGKKSGPPQFGLRPCEDRKQRYDPEKAFKGYTLYAPQNRPPQEWTGLYSHESVAYLIDINGNEVHKWRLPCPPGNHGILLENGNLLVSGVDGSTDNPDKPGNNPGCKYLMGGVSGYLFELDWEEILFSSIIMALFSGLTGMGRIIVRNSRH